MAESLGQGTGAEAAERLPASPPLQPVTLGSSADLLVGHASRLPLRQPSERSRSTRQLGSHC